MFRCLIFLAAAVYTGMTFSKEILDLPLEQIKDREGRSDLPASAFEKIDMKSTTYCPQHSNSLNETFDGKSVVVVKNVGFGVTGASQVNVGLNMDKYLGNALMEFRIDAADGPLIMSLPLNHTRDSNSTVVKGTVIPIKGNHDLYVIFHQDVNPANISWFQFEVSGPNPYEYYIIMSRMHSKAITVEKAEIKNNSYLRLFPFTYGTHQMFRFEKTNHSSYQVIARHSDMVVEVSKGAFTESTYLTQVTYNGSQQQEWYIDVAGEGTVKIMSRLTGRCMTVQNSSPNDNIFLVQNACANLTSQRWYLIPVC